MTFRDWCRLQGLYNAPAATAWQAGQENMREQAKQIANAHICGCGDHATEVARKIGEIEIK